MQIAIKISRLAAIRPERLFLAVALLAGPLIIWRLPPLFGNDEIVHFPRAFQVAGGQWRLEHLGGYNYGGRLPLAVAQMNDDFRRQVQAPQPDSRQVGVLKKRYGARRIAPGEGALKLPFTSAGVYSAWAYLPPALGVGLARAAGLPVLDMVYLARLTSLLAWVVLVYLAIRLMPVGKHFLLAAALLPTSLVQGSTVGMDGLVSGLAWVITAATVAAISGHLRLTRSRALLVAAAAIYLATTKQGYFLVAALPLLIPAKLLPFRRPLRWRVGFLALLAVVAAWYILATAPLAGLLHEVQRPGLYVNASAQLMHLLGRPDKVLLAILLAPFKLSYLPVYAGVVGVLTNRLIYLPSGLIVLLYAALAATLWSDSAERRGARVNWRFLAGGAAALVGTVVLINLALYLSFTTVGRSEVEGVQGRYFLPLVPLIPMMLAGLAKTPGPPGWVIRLRPLASLTLATALAWTLVVIG